MEVNHYKSIRASIHCFDGVLMTFVTSFDFDPDFLEKTDTSIEHDLPTEVIVILINKTPVRLKAH